MNKQTGTQPAGPQLLSNAQRRTLAAVHWRLPAGRSASSLVEEVARRGEAGDCEEAEDGGVERGVGLDDVKHRVLVGVLKDGAHLSMVVD